MWVDPFPALAYLEALRLLQQCFGKEAVSWEQPFGSVIIRLPRIGGTSGLFRLTWQQAKYLAVYPAFFRTILLGKYPADWPDHE